MTGQMLLCVKIVATHCQLGTLSSADHKVCHQEGDLKDRWGSRKKAALWGTITVFTVGTWTFKKESRSDAWGQTVTARVG